MSELDEWLVQTVLEWAEEREEKKREMEEDDWVICDEKDYY